MKRWPLLILGLAALGLLVLGAADAALSQGRGQGFRPCPYTPYRCSISSACKPASFSGKVEQVLTETLEEGMSPGMAVILNTTEGKIHVHLGPVWYLERQEFTLQPGDQVSVKGLCEKFAGKTRVIASELTKGDHVLQSTRRPGSPQLGGLAPALIGVAPASRFGPRAIAGATLAIEGLQ